MKTRIRPMLLGVAGVMNSLFVGRTPLAASFSTIVTNGPATNRVNLVFLSEGYTNGQLGKFLTDATNATHAFFKVEPYAEYSNYFNVFAIYTNSAHAGSTHLAYSSYTPGYTCFNSTYDGSDRIITIPPNPSDSINSHGQGKVDSLLQTFLPSTNNDMAILLVNDLVDGGSDNFGKVAITSVADASYFLVHESGHALGRLGDEYSSPYPGYPEVEEPNTTTNTVFSKIKWKAWISTNTPLPTPPDVTYQFTIGLFEGAHYHTTNWYRPYYECCMKSFGNVDFCPVCQEALVLGIYGKVRPLDSRAPLTSSLTVSSNQLLTFNLDLLQPATHELNVQWLSNNVAIGGATGPILSLWPTQLGNGTNKVEADVWDATDKVRTDTQNLLKLTNVWTLNVTVPQLQIDSVKYQTNGSFSFRVTGTAPLGVAIQISTNLVEWTSVKTNSLNNGQLFYTNYGSNLFLERFFRTQTPPR